MVNDNLAIEIQNLNKTYADGKLALSDICLNIPKGSFYGLLGANGAGKSTIINILANTTIKTNGLVKICGYDIQKQTTKAKSSIGIVPQEVFVDPFFTVAQTLENIAGYYGIPKSKRITDQIITALGLEGKRNATPRKLSGGMKRRLLIGKALVHNPDVVVLDEPTAGVDIELRRQLWEYIKKLNASGKTIVLTTHYLEEAESLCDKIAIIHKGKVVADDKKEVLMSNIASKKIIVSLSQEVKLTKSLQKLGMISKGNKIEFTFNSKETSMNDILNSLAKAKLPILDIKIVEPKLEDVFMNLTYGT